MISKERYLKLKKEINEIGSVLKRYKLSIRAFNNRFNRTQNVDDLRILRNYQLAKSNLTREYNLINDLIQTTKELIKLKGIK